MLLLPLVLVNIENQNVNCQVASVQWWHKKESMTKKPQSSVFNIAVFKLLNKVAAG